MRSNRPATTQTTCDCEDCWSFAVTAHVQRSADQADRHLMKLAAEGWTDVEGRDYCPGCPVDREVADHDHTGAWVDASA